MAQTFEQQSSQWYEIVSRIHVRRTSATRLKASSVLPWLTHKELQITSLLDNF